MTTDLLDLARRAMGSSQGLDGTIAATTTGDDSPAPDVRADPRGEDPDDPRGVDLLAIARGNRTGDATDTGCAQSEIRGDSPSSPPRSAHLARIAQPDAAGTVRLSPAELATRREPGGQRRCYTCGQAADSTWDDGSPRWRHGHDPLTGQRWTMQPRRAPVGRLLTCRACAAEHAAGTDCGPVAGSCIDASDRPGAGIDLLQAALVVFGDDVEGVSTVIDPADRPDRSNDWCAISERSAKSPGQSRGLRGHRPRDKREKREKGALDPELIPLFGEEVDGSSSPGTPA
jgi:hypothetical protein